LAKRLEAALLEWLASQGGTDLDPDRPFAEYGVDSLAAVQLVERIEATLRIPLAPVMAWDYPTPSAMAAYLARRAGDPDAEESEEVVFGDSLEVQNLLSAVEGMSDEEARAALES
jgi:acyl carrier protein